VTPYCLLLAIRTSACVSEMEDDRERLEDHLL
jgi:hypothetical protein